MLRVEGLRADAGLDGATITRHLIFNGNPGTGKTTVARLVAGIYRALGLLSKGQLVEVDRSELVAGYLGQTAMKTAEVVKSADRVACSSSTRPTRWPATSTARRPIDTLVKEMEDHRDDLVVIVAGYPLPMEVFIAQNPGLESRFRTEIDFADYTDDELVAIFEVMASGAAVRRRRRRARPAARPPGSGRARTVVRQRALCPQRARGRHRPSRLAPARGRRTRPSSSCALLRGRRPRPGRRRRSSSRSSRPRPGDVPEPSPTSPRSPEEQSMTQAPQPGARPGADRRSPRRPAPAPATAPRVRARGTRPRTPRTCPACSTAGR